MKLGLCKMSLLFYYYRLHSSIQNKPVRNFYVELQKYFMTYVI